MLETIEQQITAPATGRGSFRTGTASSQATTPTVQTVTRPSPRPMPVPTVKSALARFTKMIGGSTK